MIEKKKNKSKLFNDQIAIPVTNSKEWNNFVWLILFPVAGNLHISEVKSPYDHIQIANEIVPLFVVDARFELYNNKFNYFYVLSLVQFEEKHFFLERASIK